MKNTLFCAKQGPVKKIGWKQTEHDVLLGAVASGCRGYMSPHQTWTVCTWNLGSLKLFAEDVRILHLLNRLKCSIVTYAYNWFKT